MEKRIAIIGLGRSGTSWIQQVFDYNPDVFSIYEPERAIRSIKGNKDLIGNFEHFFKSRELISMRKRPIKRKPYRPTYLHHIRVVYIYLASILQKTLPRSKALISIPVPDFADRASLTTVVKLVAGHRQLSQLAELNQDTRFIYVVRHPCAFVASSMTGKERGKMPEVYLPPGKVMKDLSPKGSTAHQVSQGKMNPWQVRAHHWAGWNDSAISSIGKPNVRFFRYEDICSDPISVFKDMMNWSGLNWSQESEKFLNRSLSTTGDAKGYHDFVRNPRIASERWRQQLSELQKKEIYKIVASSSTAKIFYGDDMELQRLSN